MTATATARPNWIAPEVVQTSSMDCGPAALKCLLEGFRIKVSYERLREACQTDVDGTSIDTIESVANDLGLVAEQVMLPPEHLLGSRLDLPCLIAVRQADGPPHFVIVWNRLGPFLQVMDPAVGRRWVRARRLVDDVFAHEAAIPAADWRAWAATEDCLGPMRDVLAELGASREEISALIDRALGDPGWRTMAALDASIRLAHSLHRASGAGAISPVAFIDRLVAEARSRPAHAHALIGACYWSVVPDASSGETGETLRLRGAVLLQIRGRGTTARPDLASTLSPELVAALRQPTPDPLHAFWRLLRSDGLLAPLSVAGALAVAMAGVVIEALLFRGLFDLGSLLHLGSQRLMASIALLAFLSLLIAFRLPITSESMRFGRRLDVRLRMAFLHKLPRLNDRYFQSRPVSDMAERAHSLHMLRSVPNLGVQALQSVCELLLTVGGLALIDPSAAMWAIGIVLAAMVIPVVFAPLVREADLRLRNHNAALHAIHLDTLLGTIPIRVHRAQTAVRRLHESRLVEWSRAFARQARLSTSLDALQQFVCLSLACAMIAGHFLRNQDVSGSDLLLVFWTLKLPSIGHALVMIGLNYSPQRNVLLRLLEPMSAPVDPRIDSGATARLPKGAIGIDIVAGSVVAGGHRILKDIDLMIRPGEHVAIVGPSGAGKSTLLGLLLGWHRLSSGTLECNGCDLTGPELEALRLRTAWVDPAVQLWNRSLLENLTFSATDQDLARVGMAIAGANLREVLQALPAGLQEPLGEGAASLSGGEGQRLRLGRALMQSDPDLVLLDEPFRGMDRAQRERLLGEARLRWHNATLICISHDIVETTTFDRVLVVENGCIVEDGRPDVLLRSGSRYSQLLAAEETARRGIWASNSWRQLRIEDGHVADLG